MAQAYRGMAVEGRHGRIGTIVDIHQGSVAGGQQLIVETVDGTRRTFTSDQITIRGNVAYIDDDRLGGAYATHPGASQAVHTNTRADELEVTPGEEVRIPVVHEEATVSTRQVERGGVRVHRLVNERVETVEQPITNEEVEVERIPIGRAIEGDQIPQMREEGDTLIIPVLEEMLVVEKRLVLKEEVRITRRRLQDVEQVQVVLREEDVQVERIDDAIGSDQTGLEG